MPQKHALIIGIDAYVNLDAQYQLRGCVNDARLVRQVLGEHFGFADADMVSLHNEEATRERILAEMERLVAVVGADDVVAFHFSGHGSRRTSISPEEGSGKDSTIMPQDSGRDPLPNLDIVDHEINAWLARLSAKTRALSLVFDCCHSGTITRDPFAAQARSAPDDLRSLADMGVDRDRLPIPTRFGSRDAGSTGNWLALSDAYVVMSGCRNNELAHEFIDEQSGATVRNGALTHFLVSAMLQAQPGTTYRDIFDSARIKVSTRFPDQHPQIEGALDRALYGGHDIASFRYVLVAAVADDRIVLSGGAAHGLARGSRWAVYPPATKDPASSTPLASIEIDSVGALQSEAKLLASEAAVVPGARCVEVLPALEHFRLKIDLGSLPEKARSQLAGAIAQSLLLAVADSMDAADLKAYLLAPRQSAGSGDPLPQLQQIAQQSWAIVDRSGAPVMPLHREDEPEISATLLANLETLARYRNALILDNPASALAVDFNLYREDGAGGWQLANGANEVFKTGDCIAFEVVNREARPVFVSVLDFGLSGKIQLLYPPNKTSEFVEAGKTLRIGSGTRRIRLGPPAGFAADRGSETFKAFITTNEADFSWLQQAGTRSAAGPRSRLQQLFAAAYQGPPTRDAVIDTEPEPGEDWRAVSRVFELVR